MTYPKGGYAKLDRQELLSLAQSGDDNAKIALRKLDAAMADHPEIKRAGTIDLTPTWTGVLPIIIYALENGTEEGKRMAKLELKTMAEAADRYNASVKERGLTSILGKEPTSR